MALRQLNCEHERSYQPYGGKTALTGSPDATFIFNEKRQEPGLGLLSSGARHYDPTLRQFISLDPLRFEGAADAIAGANLLQPYVYAGADPVTFRDQQGMRPETIAQGRPEQVFVPGSPTCIGNCYKSLQLSSQQVFERNFGPRMEAAQRQDDFQKVLLVVYSAAFAYATLAGPTAGALAKAADAAIKAARGKGPALKDFSSVATRTTRGGGQGVRLTRPDGSVLDITGKRVKEFVPNTHPSAPPGTLQRVKFPNAQPGTKGLKRDPTPEEIRLLEEASK